MIADKAEDGQRLLVIGQQAVLHAGDRVAGASVRVQHGVHLVRGHVDGGMDREARGIDRIVGLADRVAVLVDLDQRGRGDLAEQHAVGVEQEVVGARHPQRDMRAEEVAPAVMVDEAVAGREIAAHFPFLGRVVAGDGAVFGEAGR